jgi:hypothetical protein
MAATRRRVALALGTAWLAVAVPAAAQGLRTLQVEALGMHADHTQVTVGEVFHLAIHTRVREHVAALDELVVPNLGTMQLEGDERRVTGSAAGTDVVETLTLEPTASGTYTFNGAYLDAIDARTGKPTRFSANPVRVVVVDAPGLLSPSSPRQWRTIGEVVLLGAAFVMIAIVVALPFRSRRRRPAPAENVVPPAAAPPPAPSRTPRDEVADALRAYRSAPATGSLLRLRGALFAAAGAQPGATLRDALAVTGDLSLRAALGAAERTAFGPAYLRDASSVELIDATQRWLG